MDDAGSRFGVDCGSCFSGLCFGNWILALLVDVLLFELTCW